MPGRLALVLAGLLWTVTAAHGGPVLYLRPAAVLPAGVLSLGAIADVHGVQAQEAAELAAVPLGRAPARAARRQRGRLRRDLPGPAGF